ncbi:MAG TPA: hypothetical protein VKT78_08725 [Fimbriimonadaceae bacterium]|nr:hypothetical protein [Fimbriimonadaceae bacterium]
MDALNLHRTAIQELVARGQGERRGSPRFLAQEKRSILSQAEILGLPEALVAPIQDLNLSSPTFGQFAFMLDYDPLP